MSETERRFLDPIDTGRNLQVSDDDYQYLAETGPELYRLGVIWLEKARADLKEFGDENQNCGLASASAAIAAAAFAGAHAAAFGQLAADAAHDEGDTKLAIAWATAVGARVKDAE